MQLKTDGSEEQEDKLCTTKPLTDKGRSRQQEILSVASDSQPNGQHRGSDHSSTRTSLNGQIHCDQIHYDSQQAPSCILCEGAPLRISNT